MTQSTSNLFARSATEMYVRRSVWGVVRQRGQAARGQAGRRQLGGLADDLVGSLARHPPAAHVGEEMGVWVGRKAAALEAVDMGDDLFEEARTDLDLSDPGLG